MDEISQSKAQALQGRIERRNEQNDSILDSMGLAGGESVSVSEVEAVEANVHERPLSCGNCKGTGKVASLFSKWECMECHGTGFDLSNPVAVIKWQTACMEWAKSELLTARHQLKLATTTKEEREAEAVNEFYRSAKIKD